MQRKNSLSALIMSESGIPSQPPVYKTNLPETKHWCYTETRISKTTYLWAISNFSLCSEKVDEILKSSTFTDRINSKLEWCLEIKPKGSVKSNDYISLFLSRVTCIDTNIRASLKISIINSAEEPNKIFRKGSDEFIYLNEKTPKLGWDKFIKRDFLLDKLNKFLHNDILTLSCEVCVALPSVNKTSQIKIPKFSLPEDLGSTFEMQKFTDITLLVNGREFKAHKFILAARSPVFAAMFDHEMKETNEKSVTINDIEHTIFEKLLRFMYTGRVTNLRTVANSLLVAADKYAVNRLKVMCEESLSKNLSWENAADILILADLYNADQLKEETLQFINNNAVQVMESTVWKSMIQSYPHLIEEVCRSVLAI